MFRGNEIMTTEEKAARLAEFIRRLEDFSIVAEIDGNYNHIGATIADAVLQANMKYETHVRPRIVRIKRMFPDAATMSGLKKILLGMTASDFLDWRGMDRVNRFREIVDLFSYEKIETEENLRDWLMNDRNLLKLAMIKGIGPKTIDYLKILTGIQTCAIDRHLLDFLKQAGIEISNYNEAKTIINLSADILGVQRSYLDHSIWEYISKQGAPVCK
jgi:thermostable 8-oxoguanine DNA glycosylase